MTKESVKALDAAETCLQETRARLVDLGELEYAEGVTETLEEFIYPAMTAQQQAGCEVLRWRHLALELAEYLYPQELEDAKAYEGDICGNHIFHTVCEALGLSVKEELSKQ